MLINYVPGEECRIAITEDGKLEEFYQERGSTQSHVGNIYKGRVTNVEASIQAAFVDFGLERNGFLHISDVHPKYFPGKDREAFEELGSKTPRHDRPLIQKCLKRGDEVLVQVLKEGIGTKGPTLTSYLSIPGRFIVMMPDMSRLGVSRKVEDDDARRAMRKVLAELNPPDGFGFIVRTAGMGQTKTDLKRDLAYLQRLWKAIEGRRKQLKNVGELYTESDLIIRTIRDVFSSDIERIVVDDLEAARRARDFLAIANPRAQSQVVHYNDPVPLFHRFEIEAQIESIYQRQVDLPSGASLVIDQTEALVAIDVNSGKSRDARDAETNAFQTNMEAAEEICRQLRLRDLGGVVVMDLIDMRDIRHRRKTEQCIRDNLKRDRARTRINAISQFGILEMTRQRMRPSLKKAVTMECSHCGGTGSVKSPESVVLAVMRQLSLVMQRKEVGSIELMVSPDVAFQLLNRKRAQLVALETQFNKPVMVRVGGHTIDHIQIAAFDSRGGSIDITGMMQISTNNKEWEAILQEVDGQAPQPLDAEDDALDVDESAEPQAPAADTDEETSPKRKRRRRRGSRGKRKRDDASDEQSDNNKTQQQTASGDDSSSEHASGKAANTAPEADHDASNDPTADNAGEQSKGQADASDGDAAPAKTGRRRRRGGRRRSGQRDKDKQQGDNVAQTQDNTKNNGDGKDNAAGQDHANRDHPPQRVNQEGGRAAIEPAKPAASSGSGSIASRGYANRVVKSNDA